MVIGLLVTSIASGTIVGRTGRYKIFPVAGSLIMALGLYLLSRMDAAHAALVRWPLYMFVLGVGIGLSMQVLTIIVQNTADYQRPRRGHLRGDVLPHPGQLVRRRRLRHDLRQRPGRQAAGGGRGPPGVDPAAISTPRRCTPTRRRRSHRSSTPTRTRSMSSSSPRCRSPWLAFVLSLFLKEVPLRGTSRAARRRRRRGLRHARGRRQPQQLQIAIARLFRARGPRGSCRRSATRPGTTWTSADGWCVGQVHIANGSARHQPGGDQPTGPGARPVLKPAFDTARDDGYLTGDDDQLTLTEAGEQRSTSSSSRPTPGWPPSSRTGERRTTNCSPGPWTTWPGSSSTRTPSSPGPVRPQRSRPHPDDGVLTCRSCLLADARMRDTRSMRGPHASVRSSSPAARQW